MPDNHIRRRRAILALLIVIALILLTAYFGGSTSGPLHGVQRGFSSALSPVQKGASKVLSPVRDVFGWISSTAKAKSENKQLRAQVRELQSQVDQNLTAEAQLPQVLKELKLQQSGKISAYGPVGGTVIARNSSLWYDTIEISIGSGNGVSTYDPVLGDGALVGYVLEVSGSSAWVRLLTSPKFAVGAMVVANHTSYSGVLEPKVGNPEALVLQNLPTSASITYGANVVCSGFKDTSNALVQSYCPAGIPIGTVSNSDTTETLADDQTVSVAPSADIQHLAYVQVLTDPQAATTTTKR